MADEPHDWQARYERGSTPWDLGEPHPELAQRLNEDPTLGLGKLGHVFIPGCGTGHDALAFAKHGWEVTALDIVDSLTKDVSSRLAPFGGEFICADFFQFRPKAPFQLVFDHTFFCALPLSKRKLWGEHIGSILSPSAQVVSLVFPENRPVEEGGPPFGMNALDVEDALGTSFDALFEVDAISSPGRWWPERWLQLQKSAY